MNHDSNLPSDRSSATDAHAAKSPLKDASRFEKYATTQAAADGVEGDVRKKKKTEAEMLAAQMTDRR